MELFFAQKKKRLPRARPRERKARENKKANTRGNAQLIFKLNYETTPIILKSNDINYTTRVGSFFLRKEIQM